MFFVQINHTGKGFLFLIFREIKLRKYSSLHKLFYGLGLMEVIPKKYFLRTAKKYKKKHYDLSKVNKVVSLIEKEDFEQLYTKHKLGVIH